MKRQRAAARADEPFDTRPLLPPLGVHTSIAGGLPEAIRRGVSLGCTAIQLFSHSPRSWTLREITPEEAGEFRRLAEESGIRVFIHGSYLINLASVDEDTRARSVSMVARELNRADLLGVPFVVIHTGSASGLTEGEGLDRAGRSLAEIARLGRWRSSVVLENTSGCRGDFTYRMEALGRLAGKEPRLVRGVCLDTCHAFAAGYDLTTVHGRREFTEGAARSLGKGRIRLLHCNDSLGEVGSRRDRHAHIGNGRIGRAALGKLLRTGDLAGIPVILETPRSSEEDDIRNLRTLRRMLLRRRAPGTAAAGETDGD